MPPPGDSRPASFHVHLRDRIWDAFYAPVDRIVGITATGLNRLQYLTLRGYLTLVSGALVALLAILAIWQ
jgi:hydrogenase-4 component B